MNSPLLSLLITLTIGLLGSFYFKIVIQNTFILLLTILAMGVVAICIRKRRQFAFVLIGVAAALLLTHDMQQRMLSFADLEGFHGKEGRWVGRIIGRVTDATAERLTIRSRFVMPEKPGAQEDRYYPKESVVRVYRHRFQELPNLVGLLHKRVVCKVVLRAPRRKTVPGSVDRALFALSSGVDATGTLLTCQALATDTSHLQASSAMKERVKKLLSKHVSEANQQILRALLIGEKSALSQETKTTFRKAGVYHLLVVSGLHLGLLGSLAYVLAIFPLSFFPRLLISINRRLLASACALVVMGCYVYLVGMQPPLIRAFALAVLLLMALLGRRPFYPLHALFIAAIGFILIEPFILFSVSFQLTMVATFGILYGTQYLSRPFLEQLAKKNRVDGRGLRWSQKMSLIFLGLAFTALFAFLFTLPLIITYFHKFSAWSLISNIIYTPIVGWLILPLGFLTVVAIWLVPGLAPPLLFVLNFLMDGLVSNLSVIAELPASNVVVATPGVWLTVCWYAFWLLLLGHERWRQYFYRWFWQHKRMALAGVLLVVTVFSGMQRGLWSSGVRGALLDVGNGLAAVFEIYKPFRPREVVLVDTGPGSRCRSSLYPYLNSRGIRQIAAVYISHWDEDHAGCLDELTREYKVAKIYASYKKESGPPVEVIRRGSSQHFGDLKIAVLHPERLLRKENDRSLVLYFSYPRSSPKPWRWLLPGDVEAAGEAALVQALQTKQAVASRPVDLLVAPHHGSKTSSSKDFVRMFQPAEVLISRSRPSSTKVARRYEEVGARVYHTRRHGTLLLHADGDDLRVSAYTCDDFGKPYNGWGRCP